MPNPSQMGRSQCCDTSGLKKGPWTPEEDQKLMAYIEQNGLGSWRALPPKAGLQRCGKSCRLRWTNYLRPDIKRGKFTLQEEQTIIQLHALLGNRWSAIATHLQKRTDNEIKNYWNTHLKKKLTKMGIDPVTHKPINNEEIPLLSAADHPDGQPNSDIATSLSHTAQWETARVEAEARLARQSKLRSHLSSIQQIQNPEEPDGAEKVWCGRWSSESTERNDEKMFPAIGNVASDLESPTTSTVTFLGNTRPTMTAGVVDKSVPISEFVGGWDNKAASEQDWKGNRKSQKPPENQEGVGNCLSFSPSLHNMPLLSMKGTVQAENVAGEEDFTDVLLKNSDDDPRDVQLPDGGGESENGGAANHDCCQDNKDYWDTILGEFLPY